MTKLGRLRTGAALVATILLILLVILPFAKHARMLRFYNGALDETESSTEHLQAVEALSKSNDAYAHKLLLQIALDRSARFDTISAAVAALARTKDPNVSAALSRLLQPHHALDLRRQVAEALSALPCPADCASQILHYLERMWTGETNIERQGENNPDRREYFEERQEELVAVLHDVLLKNRIATLTALQETYGLGSLHPSRFCLHVTGELGLTDACPQLLRPRLEVFLEKAERDELQLTKKKLGCVPGPA